MWPFWKSATQKKRLQHQESPPIPEWSGEYRGGHSHVVQCEVLVAPGEESALTALCRHRSWLYRCVSKEGRKCHYELRVPVLGSSVGAARAAAVELDRALKEEGVTVEQGERRAEVLQGGLLAPKKKHASKSNTSDVRVYSIPILLLIAAVALGWFVVEQRPPQASSVQLGIAILALLSLYGVWHLFKSVERTRVDAWAPTILTLAAGSVFVGAVRLVQNAYLHAFGISIDEVALESARQIEPTVNVVTTLFIALFLPLGAIGLSRYFHLLPRGMGVYGWIAPVNSIIVVSLFALWILMDGAWRMGLRDVDRYREAGGPVREHLGVNPIAVCSDDAGEVDSVPRIGPELPNDRPVLYFEGAGDMDVFWDPANSTVVRIPKATITMHQVADLDVKCSAPPR